MIERLIEAILKVFSFRKQSIGGSHIAVNTYIDNMYVRASAKRTNMCTCVDQKTKAHS